jgi:hypothetical protein
MLKKIILIGLVILIVSIQTASVLIPEVKNYEATPTKTNTIIKIYPTITPTITSTAIPTKTVSIPTKTDYPSWNYDNNNYNGYSWFEMWVPGLATFETQFLRMPKISLGSAVFYAPTVMEATAFYRGISLKGYVGAVAVPFCSEIGHTVWLKRATHPWEGPFIVVDCARRNDIYGQIIYREQVVEVDFNTAVSWGMARYGGTQNDGRWSSLTGKENGVILSMVPPEEYDGIIIDLSHWFLQNVQYAKETENRMQIQNYKSPEITGGLPSWLINGTWRTFP